MKTTRFGVYGAFPVKVRKGQIDEDEFWDAVEEERPRLSEAQGVYVFADRNSKGNFKPWYVGKAVKSSFGQRVFSSDKNWLGTFKKHKRKYVFLIVALTPTGRLRKRTTSPMIASLESTLIGRAFQKNNKIYNVSGAGMLRKMIVPGGKNSQGRPSQGAKDLKDALGI